MQMLQLKSAKERKQTSRFVGVCWDKRRGGRWAKANVDGRRIDCGLFSDEVAAAKAYNAIAARHGRPLNIIEEAA